MSVPITCPGCGADLRAGEIPPAERQMFGGESHFSRVIGIYDPQADATVDWRCPDCGHVWARTEELSSSFRTFKLMTRQMSVEPPPTLKWWQFWK
jgi:hypothetical protein